MNENEPQHFAERIVVGDENRSNPIVRNLRDVADGTVLVGQMRERVLVRGTDITLWLMIDVELLSAEWAFQFSIENESNGTRTKEETTEIGMNVTSGQEVSNSVSASAGFSGWGFSAEVSGTTESRRFTAVETSSVRTVKDTYTCPPHSSIFVYKRQYKFRCRTWFTDGTFRAALVNEHGVKIESQFENEITANQELISPVKLTNIGRITNNPPSDIVVAKGTFMILHLGGVNIFSILRQMYPWV